MKKLLLIVVLFMVSYVSFSQLAPPENLSTLTINSVPPELASPQQNINGHAYISKGITNMVCGAIFTGCGAAFLVYQPSPYVNYDTSTRFWCGVSLCALGGIDFIVGTAYLISGSIILNKEKGIGLSPSTKGVGFAINF